MRGVQAWSTAKKPPHSPQKKTQTKRNVSSLKGNQIISKGNVFTNPRASAKLWENCSNLPRAKGIGKLIFMFPFHLDCTGGNRVQALQIAWQGHFSNFRSLAPTSSRHPPRQPTPHDYPTSSCPTKVVPAECDLGHPQPMPTEVIAISSRWPRLLAPLPAPAISPGQLQYGVPRSPGLHLLLLQIQLIHSG